MSSKQRDSGILLLTRVLELLGYYLVSGKLSRLLEEHSLETVERKNASKILEVHHTHLTWHS